MEFLYHLRNLELHWLELFLPIRNWMQLIPSFPGYINDWKKYEKLGNMSLKFSNSYPCLLDKTRNTPFDPHYYYQAIWAAKHIAESHPSFHVDIGSQVLFIGILSTFLPITFVDIRPPKTKLSNFRGVAGNLLQLPFPAESIYSLSCLHVIEHIGMGRYGDAIDPDGTIHAAHEIYKVMAPGGNLYLSVPIGRPRICYNAHRIHSVNQIIDLFEGYDLIDFSISDDQGEFFSGIKPDDMQQAEYACGMFHLRRHL